MAKTAKVAAFSTISEAEVLTVLTEMENDKQYNTESRYTADTVKYPNNQITFSEKHIEYLRKFPYIDPRQYIINLKLITKKQTL